MQTETGMQRDMGLIRQIMFKLEAEPGGFAPRDFTSEGYRADQVSYHVYLRRQDCWKSKKTLISSLLQRLRLL